METRLQASPQSAVAVTNWCRPKRLAFLVDPDTTPVCILDQIIRFCLTLWGGRFHPIIPCSGSSIAADWWKLLEAADPDIVLALVEVSEPLYERIYRHVLPLRDIVTLTAEEDYTAPDRLPLVCADEVKALGVYGIPRHLYMTSLTRSGPLFGYLRTVQPGPSEETFALRNFGTLGDSQPVHSMFRDVPSELVEADLTPPRDTLDYCLNPCRPYLPVDLCQLYAPRPFLAKEHPQARGFHLVIGDHPSDVTYAWDRALAARAPAFVRDSLWLPPALCQDGSILAAVARFAQTVAAGGGCDPGGTVVSYSVDEVDLRRVAGEITSLSSLPFRAMRLSADEFPMGDPVSHTSHWGFPMEQWLASGDRGPIAVPRPPFLGADGSDSGWMVDLQLRLSPEREGCAPWRLPKRAGLARTFTVERRECRIVAGGLPSVDATAAVPYVNLRVPSDWELIATCIARHPLDIELERSPRFRARDLSDKGQYFQGMLRLFGGLENAGSFFRDPYWRFVFLKMADWQSVHASSACVDDGADRDGQAGDNPRAVRGSGPSSERPPVAGEARPVFLTIKNLRSCFGRARRQRPEPDALTFGDYESEDLPELVDRGVLMQGVEVKCPHCGTAYWYAVGDIRPKMRCSGCLEAFALPPNPEWSFRLNSLVSANIRRYGALPLLAALDGLLGYPGCNMFLFLPCLNIREAAHDTHYGELDLAAIRYVPSAPEAPEFLIGEVKTYASGFRETHLAKLEEVAREVLPDRVVVAAGAGEWPEEIASRIQRLRGALEQIDVRLEVHIMQIPELADAGCQTRPDATVSA